ncbi:right-handed parallel beta-helix repeat-containing protein [Paenibacillus sp. WQ 127069]|uniref:Right-handed parallel beta-helix repeat-containing protein n=1 Tax=Paenibacillus baimaensis TaxID=2982185 RepID=A0ABT2UGN8_9BACL|nr:right-handed parallel beta-helix repeat-containing protein [Paenibacillus sp. WQ 127069]MCU6793777.1 right-handed parallel beta-helix repeat-containing protein [Paenibacillus sp. WQ 127069]
MRMAVETRLKGTVMRRVWMAALALTLVLTLMAPVAGATGFPGNVGHPGQGNGNGVGNGGGPPGHGSGNGCSHPGWSNGNGHDNGGHPPGHSSCQQEPATDPDPTVKSYYVSPYGNDEGTGAINSPFRTLTAARDAVRTHIAAGMTQDVVVYLRGGIYRLAEPFQLTSVDSGRDGYKVTYRSFPGEKADLDGSSVISGWSLYSGNIYSAPIGTGIDVDVLYEGEERAVLARYPNRANGKDQYSRVATYASDLPKRKFGYTEGDIPAVAHPEELQVYIWPGGTAGHWSWSSNTIGVESVDTTNRIVTLESDTTYENGVGSRYYVQNGLEMLDAPGEFYIDKTAGVLYYYPFDAGALNGGVTIPREGNIAELIGASSTDPIHDIVFDSLVIRNSDRLGDGIHGQNIEHFTLSNSKIYNIGEHGVQLLGWAHHNLIESNEVHHVGYNGISVEGIGRVTTVSSSDNDSINNHVYTTGLIYGNAGGIRYYYSEGNRIAYNLVHDIKRHALHLFDANRGIIGTTIGGVLITKDNFRNYQRTRDNIVEFNEVYDAVNDSQDAGPIATYGGPFGNILRNNYLHDNTVPATTSSSFGFGFYLDDSSDYVTVEDNIIENLQQQPGGSNNALMLKGIGIQVKNNIVANNNDSRSAIGSTETGGLISSEITLERNLYYNLNKHLYYLDYWTPEKLTSSDYNLFHSATGQYTFGSTIPVSEYGDWLKLYKGKYDQHSLRTDPLLMNPDARDYRLRYDSPAYKLGFRELNIEDIGLRADYPFADSTDLIHRVIPRFEGDAVNRSFVQLASGQSRAIELTVRTETGFVADLSDAAIAFVSGSPSVASVSPQGVVTANGAGVAKVTITVTKDGVTKSAAVHVLVDDQLQHIGINGPDTVYMNTPVTMDVYGMTGFGAHYDLPDADISYTIAPSAVATVNSQGAVTGVQPGEAVLTVSATVTGTTYLQAVKPITVKISSNTSTEFDDWRSVNGSWQIAEEENNGNLVYRSLTTSGSSRTIRDDMVLEDFAVSARVKIDQWASAAPTRIGLMGRYVDSNNFYYAFYEGNSKRFKILKLVNGAQTQLAQSSVMNIDFTSGFRQLALKFEGEQISLLLDGNVMLTVADSSHASGKPGLYAYSQPVAYDDISIHVLQGGDGQEGPLPSEWSLKPYGPQAAFATFHAGADRFTLEASGADVWGSSDQFGYMYQWVEMPAGGKVTMTLRLESIEQLVSATMAGIMMRGSDSANAANVFTRIIGGGNNQVTVRQSAGGSTSNQSIPGIGTPTELKLVREGDTFTAYYKKDGADWIQHSTWTVSLPNRFMVGMALSARHATDYAKAIFSNVSIVVK